MSFRYWRIISLIPSVNNSYSGFSEVKLYDSSLTDLVATVGGVATDYGTAFSATYNAPKAFDGNTSTYFSSKQNSFSMLGYHFASAVSVKYVDLSIYSTYLPIREFIHFQTSADAIDWKLTHRCELISGTWANGQTVRLELFEIPNPFLSHENNETILANDALTSAQVASGFAIDRHLPRETYHRDVLFRGNMRVKGTVSIYGNPNNTPISKRVVLYDQKTSQIVDAMWSDPITGAYQFDFLKDARYMVIAFDDTRQYNAEIISDIVPIDME